MSTRYYGRQDVLEPLLSASSTRECSRCIHIRSKFEFAALVIGTVFAFAILIAIFRYLYLRPRRKVEAEARAQAIDLRRQREIDRFFSQERMDVARWQREREREARIREEETPPPYSRQPRLPSLSEQGHLIVRDDRRQGNACDDSGGDATPDLRRPLMSKKQLRSDADIRYPPPSYYLR